MLLYFKEKGKLEYPAKTSQSKGENQYQTQPKMALTPDHMGGSECFHHCATLQVQ